MKKIASIFSKVFTLLNIIIYILLMVALFVAIFDDTMYEKFDFDWWLYFLVAQIWFNVVIERKK